LGAGKLAKKSKKNEPWQKDSSELLLSKLRTLEHKHGYISEEQLKKAAKEADISIIQAYEVATFYSFLTTKKLGKYVIRVCNSPSCFVNGSETIVQVFERLLKIKSGQTTKDGKFTLLTTSCIGCCHMAPAALINQKAYGNLNEGKIKEVLAKCK
jgi:NADH-quinone oxidoreductase subunit E